jgi:phospholipase/carboxylesterase
VLLFHGVGSSAGALQSLGASIARTLPEAAIVSVQAPTPGDLGGGWQWFSVKGVTEDNRPGRIAAVLPVFVDTVRQWQTRMGVDAGATSLAGFSQGAIMSLAASQLQPPIAGQVISIAGRLVPAPTHGAPGVRIHFLHGDADTVVAPERAQTGFEQLQALGARVTLDRYPGLGHGVDIRVVRQVIGYLQG